MMLVDPRPGAVYRCFATDGQLLYVGSSSNPLQRLTDQRSERFWAQEVATVTVTWFASVADARAAEAAAIAAELPKWNTAYLPKERQRKKPEGSWSAWEVATAFSMRSKGYSANDIGKSLGRSRCGVLGMFHRAKCDGASAPQSKQGAAG